ncbi:MAG TPA: hypothetical protein VGT44_02800 [Ktedonobacteraceae bacterium]|nr:hypothetical protein [Ktedonobacteraceae bacterium]
MGRQPDQLKTSHPASETPTRLLPGDLPDTPSPESLPTLHLANGSQSPMQNGSHHEMPIFSPESLNYTSKAAEHWRSSWQDRQYAEAGPAEDVSKGQASVPSPLNAMQHSFVRMRAVILKQKEDKRKVSFGFWITLLIMLCLIGGMGAYIIYSYLPNSSFNAAHIAQPAAGQSPALFIVGAKSSTFKIGQTLYIAGSHFAAHDVITFMLDTTTPIMSNGTPLRAQANAQGAFNVTIKVGKDWPIGDRIIQAVDATANTSSYLNIQIIPAAKPVTNSPNLSIALNGQPLSLLQFTNQVGHADPPSQRITITNTSNAVLQWSASVNTDWLVIEDNNNSGQLAIAEPQTIGIGVVTSGLSATLPNAPYVGQINFIINNNEVLTLRVQLTITVVTPELSFSPSPVVGIAKNGSCLDGTLTLINLGSAVVTWAVNPDSSATSFIQFVSSLGKRAPSGSLNPSGMNGDTVILTLQCTGVKAGQSFHISIYGNGIPASDTVQIE